MNTNPLYHELDRLEREIRNSRSINIILFFMWTEANEEIERLKSIQPEEEKKT
jgi:hypothetical protein